MTVMEGDGVINMCAQLFISSGKTLGTDIWVPLATSADGTASNHSALCALGTINHYDSVIIPFMFSLVYRRWG